MWTKEHEREKDTAADYSGKRVRYAYFLIMAKKGKEAVHPIFERVILVLYCTRFSQRPS